VDTLKPQIFNPSRMLAAQFCAMIVVIGFNQGKRFIISDEIQMLLELI